MVYHMTIAGLERDLPGHFVDQGDALGLRCDEVVIGRRLFQELPGGCHRELLIPKDDKSTDVQTVRHLANRQIPLQTWWKRPVATS